MGTWITGILLAAAAAGAIWNIRKSKKNGKSISCGGDCSHCAGGCQKKNEK